MGCQLAFKGRVCSRWEGGREGEKKREAREREREDREPKEREWGGDLSLGRKDVTQMRQQSRRVVTAGRGGFRGLYLGLGVRKVEPSLGALSLRSDVISSIKMLSLEALGLK